MHDTKERLSLLWIFALLNYLYADVLALFAIAGTGNSFEPLPQWALMGSAVLMEIPIAMILACRLLPFRANRLANIIAGRLLTLDKRFPDLRSASGSDGAGHLLLPSTCSSQRSKLYAPWSSSGRPGLGQGVKAQLVRSRASANRQLASLLLNSGIALVGYKISSCLKLQSVIVVLN